MPLSVSVLVQGKTLPLPSCRPGQNGSVTDYRVLGTQIVVFGWPRTIVSLPSTSRSTG